MPLGITLQYATFCQSRGSEVPLSLALRLGDTGFMDPYVITSRRITVMGGLLAEIPPNPPAGLRTWSCHCFFVPGAKAAELKPKIKQEHIDVTEVDGGCWVYGGVHWLEKTLQDLAGADLLALPHWITCD